MADATDLSSLAIVSAVPAAPPKPKRRPESITLAEWFGDSGGHVDWEHVPSQPREVVLDGRLTWMGR